LNFKLISELIKQQLCAYIDRVGYAHGSLLKDEANQAMNEIWTYLEQQVDSAINFLPSWLQDWVSELGTYISIGIH
jgi:hypothetical protein